MKTENEMKALVRARIGLMIEQVLDYVQVAVPAPDGYKAIRGRILRVGNNCMREVDKEFDEIIDQNDISRLLNNLDREEGI